MASKIDEAQQQLHNQRKASRKPVALIAELRISDGARFKVTVLDLSSTGFKIQTANHVPPDRKIYLTIPAFQTLQGTVAWNDKEFYGCEFSQPLMGTVYDHLANRFPLLVR